jgi:hypothetical protein
MKKQIILALVAVAALAAVTTGAGAATASASTVLCKTSKEKCPSSEVLPAGSWVRYPLENFELRRGEEFRFKCSNGIIGAVSQAQVGTPLPMSSEAVLWNCRVAGSTSCSSVQVSKNKATLEAEGLKLATFRIGTASEPMTVSFTCQLSGGLTAECTFKAANSVPLMSHYNPAPLLEELDSFSGTSFVNTGGNNVICGAGWANATLRVYGINSGDSYPALF